MPKSSQSGSEADVKLVIGADHALSLSQMKSDITSILSSLNSSQNNYKIKVGLTVDKRQGYSSMLNDIKSITNRFSKRSTVAAKLKIGIDQSYIEKQYKSVISKISKGQFAGMKGLSLVDDKSLSKLKSEVAQAQKIINDYKKGILTDESIGKVGAFSSASTAKEISNLENYVKRVESVRKKLFTSTKSLSGINSADDLNVVLTQYKNIQSKLASLSSLDGTTKLSRLSEIEAETNAYLNQINTLKATQNVAKATDKAKADAARQTAKNINAESSAYIKQINLIKQIQTYLRSNSKVSNSSYGNQINSILSNLQSGRAFSSKEIQNYATEFKNLQTQINAAGLAGKSFSDIISSGIKKFSDWFGISQLVMSAVQGVRNMIVTVTEIDTAMTELRKVTDLTEQQYAQFGNTAVNVAKQVGATVADTINSTADFARLGYDVEEATDLSQAAFVYKNVGDGIEDVSEASESIISTIKAFKIEASDAMGIVDQFNEVGNRFAISSEGIGTALKKSAASLATSGNTIEESIGLITGMNAVVQNPEVVGTALKTLTMYLRAAKAEAEDAGESTDGMANSVSDLQSQILTLTGGKVDIMEDESDFKSTYQIIKEISQVWSDMAEVDQAALLQLIAGKRNANVVTSLITNFSDAEAAMQAASEATGSATKENEKYLDSIEGRKAELKASFEEISTDLIDSGAVKAAVSGLTSIINAADELVDTLGVIPTLAGAVGAALSFKNVGELMKQFHY